MTTNEIPIESKKKKSARIPIEKLHGFEGHPHKVTDNEDMDELVESIKLQGIINPLIVYSISVAPTTKPTQGALAKQDIISEPTPSNRWLCLNSDEWRNFLRTTRNPLPNCLHKRPTRIF